MDVDLLTDPLQDDVHLSDIWPSRQEIQAEIERAVESDMFRKEYGAVFEGDENWAALDIPEGDRYAWDPTPPTSSSRTSPSSRRGTPRSRARAASPCSATA